MRCSECMPNGYGAKVIAYYVNDDQEHKACGRGILVGQGVISRGAIRKKYIGGTKRRVCGERRFNAPSLRIILT